MKRSRVLLLAAILALCALVLGGGFPPGPALAQEGGPVAPAVDIPHSEPTGSPDSVDAIQAALTTAFTYQGHLKKNGQPANATCSFQFSLWDALINGAQKGATQIINNAQVQDGMFTVQLNFGNQFPGDERWLQTAVQCAGDGGYVTLAPRQPLNAAPYAIGLRPGAIMQSAAPGDALYVEKTAANSVAIHGKATQAGGTGVLGESVAWAGVWGQSTSASGVVGRSAGQFAAGVTGENTGLGYGVYGKAPSSAGVFGESTYWLGVYGKSTNQVGVKGESSGHDGVQGSTSAANRVGVKGVATAAGATGVWGESTSWAGVWGQSASASGVVGISSGQFAGGVYGENKGQGYGVWGKSPNGAGVVGESTNWAGVYGQTAAAAVAAVWGKNTAGGVAGRFEGSVQITGGADLAERFLVRDDAEIEPGTLMVIDAENPGRLTPSRRAYDGRVAGVASGAGGVRPGLTLHQQGVMEGNTEVAIAGRVYVKAEADSAPIQPGDLLTASDLPGHAMKAADRARAYGAVIGKAMTGLESGTGLVLVLVNLQ
jgi:hypothetical protein